MGKYLFWLGVLGLLAVAAILIVERRPDKHSEEHAPTFLCGGAIDPHDNSCVGCSYCRVHIKPQKEVMKRRGA